MKKNTLVIAAFAALLGAFACTPIEDQMLRDKYITNAGPVLTSDELTAHLKVEQKGETNDVITVSNDDPRIGGVWHFTTATGEDILKTDSGTYTYTANGNFKVYMVAPAGQGKLVKSKEFEVKVSDVYDPWVGLLTGAKDKFDKSATKVWGFRSSDGADGTDLNGDPNGTILGMSAYGFWKWYPYSQTSGQAWWGVVTFGQAGDQTMKFYYTDAVLETFDAAGNKTNTGNFAVGHTPVDNAPIQTPKGVSQMGTFSATVPVIGSEYDDYGATTTYMLIYLDDTYMCIAHYPDMSACSAGLDWNDAVWICNYKAK